MENPNQEKMIKFCPYCGTKLDDGASFCKNCGQSIVNSTQKSKIKNSNSGNNTQAYSENPTERKTVYEGEIHKCPNCGETIKAFVSNCPSCGYEFRGSKTSTLVQELAYKLEQIESKVMPAVEKTKSAMKMVFGRDFKDDDEVQKAQDRFDEQKAQQKANLILNYTVPNTKEDMLEFMILASSNISVKRGLDDVVTKAWLSKLEQVYQKAEIVLTNASDFSKIKNIYEKVKKGITNNRIKKATIIIGGIIGWFSLLGLLWNPIATVLMLICVLILIGIAYVIIKKR